MCAKANSLLESFFVKCTSGEITLKEIKEISDEKRLRNLKSIIDVMKKQDIETFKIQVFEGRIAEAKAFKFHKEMLSLFYDFLKGQSCHVQGKMFDLIFFFFITNFFPQAWMS